MHCRLRRRLAMLKGRVVSTDVGYGVDSTGGRILDYYQGTFRAPLKFGQVISVERELIKLNDSSSYPHPRQPEISTSMHGLMPLLKPRGSPLIPSPWYNAIVHLLHPRFSHYHSSPLAADFASFLPVPSHSRSRCTVSRGQSSS